MLVHSQQFNTIPKTLNSIGKEKVGNPLICVLFLTQGIVQPNESETPRGLGQELLFGILSLEVKVSGTKNSLIWNIICYKAQKAL